MEQTGISRKTTESPEERGVALSRRSFVELAVGAIAVLPAVSGGFISPFSAETAYAAETSKNTAKIIIAKSYEAGFVVADMADGKKVPVAGASVTVTSLYNEKKISGTTDGSGCFLTDIRDLAEKETVDGVDRYFFYAKVEVTAKGYRNFRTYRVSVEGARGVLLPTRKLTGEMLYPVAVAFDDWDVLYTKNEFAVTDANDLKHTLRIDLATGLNAPITIRLVENLTHKVVLEASGVEPNYTKANVKLEDFFLLATHKSTFPKTGTYYLEILQGPGTYHIPLGLSTCAAPTGATVVSSTKMSLSPFNVGAMKPKIEIPKSVPVIGGASLEVWTPDLPVEVIYNPFGYFKIAYKSEEIGYKSKNGEPDPNAWKSHPRKTFAEQWKKTNEAREKMMKSYGDAKRREGIFKKAGYTSNLSATAMFAGILAGRWSEDSGLWRGLLGVQGTLAFNFSYAQQFMAGPIPLVLEFSFSAGISIGLSVAVATPEITSPSKYRMDYANTGITLTVPITLSLSLGLGVKGVATLSIQGVVGFTLFVHCGPLPSNATKEMTNPHVVLGLKALANVVAQAFIFTVTYPLPWKWDRPAFYDSWAPKVQTQSELSTQDDGNDGSWDTIFGNIDDMEIITEGDIGKLAEFELEWEEKSIEDSTGDDWVKPYEEYDENDDEEGWVCWGDGLEKEDESQYWLDLDESDDPDDNTSGWVYNSDGSVSGWGTWGDVEYDTQASDALLVAQSNDTSMPTGPMKLQRRVVECVTDDGIPYQMTVFDAVPAQLKHQGGSTTAVSNGSGGLMAASSASLTAQSGEGERLGVQTDERKFKRGTVRRKPGKIVNNGTKVTRPDPAPPAKLASEGGLVPQCDMKIIQGVFSDPRVKVVKLFESSYVFRIASVDIKGADGKTLNRTRIVAQKLVATGQKAEPMRVLDFKHTYADHIDIDNVTGRDDLFDYDFAIRVRTEGSYIAELDLFVISGKRANGDKTTIGQAASDQVFTHAVCQFTLTSSKLEIKYGFSVKTSDQAFAATGNPAHTYHCFSCPHIIETAKGEIVATYLDRAAASPDKVLSGDEASVGLGVCFTTRYGNFKAANVSSLIAAADPTTDKSVYEMIMLERIKFEKSSDKSETSWIPIMLRGQSKTYYYLLVTEATSVYDKLYGPEAKVKTLKKLNVTDANGNVPTRLVAWPGRSAVLASLGGKLVKGTLANLDSAPSFTFEEIGPSNFSISAFGTDNTGNFIYWPSNQEGSPGFSYDKDPDNPEKAENLPDVVHHRIMACKLRKGKFSDPFVFAEVSHDMDTLEAIGSQKNEAMAFVSCDLREVKNGKADIWYTSLPNVKCANVIGVEAVSEIAYPGEPMILNLTVRNDGNTFLSGFTAHVVEKGSKKTVSEVKLVFSKDTLIESGYNPADANGALQNVEDDYSLAPGQTSVYQIKVDIPKDWNTGEKSVSVIAKDVVVSSSDSLKTQGLATQADDDASEYDFDDSDAFEYVVGTDESDFGEEGIPFDLFDVWADEDLDEYDEGYDDEFIDAPVQDANVGPHADAPEVNGSGKKKQDAVSSDAAQTGSNSSNASSSNNNSANTNSGSSNAKSGSSSPTTGDPLGGMGGLLGVAAVAGAAMAAYSARRVANERAAAGESISDSTPNEEDGDDE